MKQLAIGQLLYSADYDDRFAPGTKWMDLAEKLSGAPPDLRCPQAIKDDGPQAYGYGFNSGIAKKKPADIADYARTILLFESADSSRNVVGTEGDEKRPGRHGGSNNYAYADGHVKRVRDPSDNGHIAGAAGTWTP